MSLVTDKKCPACRKGYLVKEYWEGVRFTDSDLYCNNCFKRLPEDKHSRSGGSALHVKEEPDTEPTTLPEYTDEDFNWYSWPDFK